MPRGGKRSGTLGKSYKQRSDLNPAVKKLPVTTAPGQSYGEAGQQAASQSAVPMASGSLPAPGGPTPDQSAPQPPPVIPMGAPSMNPGESVTATPTAPVAPAGADPLLNGVALLNSLGGSASPEVKALRNVVSAQQANSAAP